MPEWGTFAAFAGVVTAGLLLLSHASKGVVSGDGERRRSESSHPGPDRSNRGSGAHPTEARPPDADDPTGESDDALDRPADTDESDGRDDTTGGDDENEGEDAPARVGRIEDPERTADAERVADPERELVMPKSGVRYRPPPPEETPELSTAALLVNVAFSQGLFGVALLAGAWYARIPASAFGASVETLSLGGVLVGVGLGVSLYAVNEVGAAVGTAYGLGRSEELRSSLAPDTPLGWAGLLFVVLPVIAGFEELLFRGALIGAFAAGFDASPWLLAVVSSVAFALGHGAQGRLGVLVTGALGFVLAAAFVLTGSLVVVVVAHYLVNALEFVVHEGLGVEWGGGDSDVRETD